MNTIERLRFQIVELFEDPDESVMRLAGTTPLLVVGHCCCCCCCHCNFSLAEGVGEEVAVGREAAVGDLTAW
jgi:streptolysin S family bacteriocin protoxin